IRCFHVTGVQTCALPISQHISGKGGASEDGLARARGEMVQCTVWAESVQPALHIRCGNYRPHGLELVIILIVEIKATIIRVLLRSEERRVGKAYASRATE